MSSYGTAGENKKGTSRAQAGAVSRPSRALLTLYQRKGFDVARVGAPSPLAASGSRQPG